MLRSTLLFASRDIPPGSGVTNDTGGAGSEDCLYVNIYAPKGATNTSSLPVLAYIHGGGYFAGNPRSWPFDNWIQRSPTPFVAVTIYYRLSIFGFLSAPEEPGKGIYTGKDPELALNAGIHDQRLALRFIQRHIRSFGGDPERVTIMGQSAGAGAVGLHLTARSANPTERFFRRAIVQSWYRSPFALPAARKEQWEAVSNSVGCSSKSSTVAHTLECLRTVSPVRLMQAADDGKKQHGGSLWSWLPVIDGTLFKKNLASILHAVPGVDIIVGHTTADSASGGTPFEAVVNATYPGLTLADLKTLRAMYVEAGIAEESMATFGLGEAVFRCGVGILLRCDQ
ncbi:Lipase 5 OS=Candida rugosa GN=LIP5 PE=3 SV=1 [Rhizoctonia solani AG-1 IB]|uniref:Carboxylic ester hydrolase n=1 Tax=Thanatephorus cucumeris (strain AG1-IB / isolate 7/3/14) TaxID=1108050 RepID=A0A0B7FS71_THACB|nr:Lipase 5 OS=Candida rugosa GN=LIP5 PE=3 SV=1 [Rhizoctonia solani AG-1 IB]